MKQKAYDVYLNKKLIDTIFCIELDKMKIEREKEVYKSLVNHDGYDLRIVVKERLTA
jgi:hypothetical protein